jgi:succinyl-CoA synthetase beta subunit
MVRLYEYQGKEILKKEGIPVPSGGVASSPEEVKMLAEKLGKPVVIKSQILATGRFKAGGIKFANSPQEARSLANELLDSEIKGFKVEKVRVEEQIDIVKEFYCSVIIVSSYKIKAPVLMFCTEGGVDVEEVATSHPEKVMSMSIDVLEGIKKENVQGALSKIDLDSQLVEPISDVLFRLYNVARKYDALTVEINPLVLTRDGKILAVDCRFIIDDSSTTRHPELEFEVPRDTSKPLTELDKIAWKIEENDYRGVAYFMQLASIDEIKKGGYVGFHGMGGGGAMLGADALTRHGMKIANYADSSGNPPASKVYRLAKVILSLPGIEAYVACSPNIASQEMWHTARGLVKAFREDLKDKLGFPVVVLWAGNKEHEATQILTEWCKDLPIKLEVYGRDYIYELDFIARRVRSLIDEYRKIRGEG